MRPPAWLIVVLVGAALGLVFAGVSTYDFVQHLDRQVHTLHCSFIPGMGHGAGESGCQVAMMSPYSSVFRTKVWGGVPISLPAMAVFAFILCYSVDLLLSKRKDDPRSTGFLALACALPAAMSLLMGTISLTKLGTACKLCIGIYVASALCLTGAIVTWRRAVKGAQPSQPMASTGFLAGAFGVGVLFVLVPVLLYFSAAPDHSKFIGACDGLTKPDDTYGVMVRVDRNPPGGAPTIELLDPLCPACRAFEQRLGASGLEDKLDRKAVLFPLDSTCNWMITETTHPGACTVSEAVLCAGDKSPEVIAWAFENSDRIRNETKADPTAAAREVKARFPELASCVGSPEAKARVNKSLRWAVANNIRVLTPQLFVDNVKLCDEDVDLGLEYALTIMLDRHAQGTLAKSAPAPAAPTPPITAKPVEDKPASKPADKPKPEGNKPDEAKLADHKPDEATPADHKPDEAKPADHKPDEAKPADKADKPAEPMPKEEPKPADKPADKPPAGPVTSPSQVGSQGGAP
ncbi:MAG: vitamin K epoxide reductase family protein [Acidobacteriota bacterium]